MLPLSLPFTHKKVGVTSLDLAPLGLDNHFEQMRQSFRRQDSIAVSTTTNAINNYIEGGCNKSFARFYWAFQTQAESIIRKRLAFRFRDEHTITSIADSSQRNTAEILRKQGTKVNSTDYSKLLNRVAVWLAIGEVRRQQAEFRDVDGTVSLDVIGIEAISKIPEERINELAIDFADIVAGIMQDASPGLRTSVWYKFLFEKKSINEILSAETCGIRVVQSYVAELEKKIKQSLRQSGYEIP